MQFGFSALNSPGNNNNLRIASVAKVNIYVFKGTHHYISCQDDDLTILPEEVICNPLFAWTCVNMKLISDLAAKGGCPN